MRDFGERWKEMNPREVRQTAIRWAFLFFGVIIVIGTLAFVTGVITLPFRSARGVVERVLAPDAIIQNYQWYYDQYNAIMAQEANLSTLPKDARERQGLIMALNSMIGEYNSRSKQVTRNLWKAEDLPYQIELIGGAR